MKISILCPFLSGNAFGRAYVLARLLQQRFEVEIIGPVAKSGIWMPLSQEAVHVRSVYIQNGFNTLKAYQSLIEYANGQILYASKPLLTSFGIGLLRNRQSKAPLVLDIDDWEIGIFHNLSFAQKAKHLLRPNIQRLDSYYLVTRFLFSRIRSARTLTVSSHFLQNKYGGVIIPHARDTTVFDPAQYNRAQIKEELGFANKEVILFMGTPRPHKGLEELAQAFRLLNRQHVILAVAGVHPSNPLVSAMKKIIDENIIFFPMQPFQELPKFLAMADVVVIPQKADYFTQAQVPAKLVDAMAMAKPIVASAVSDIPEMLSEGCGLLVKPGDVSQLAEGIAWMMDHKQESAEMGFKARNRCQRKYSYQAISPLLCQIFEQINQ